MLEVGRPLHFATEILKPAGQIYGHQWPQSEEDLWLGNEDTQGVLTANIFDCESVEVEIETTLGMGQSRTKGKQQK